MNRIEFEKKLMDSLDIFTEKEKKNIVAQYMDKIPKEEESSVDEIVSHFGTIEEIQKKVCLEHGINPDKVLKKQGFFYKRFEELFHVIHNVVEQMSKNSFKENVKIVLDLLLLIFFICILKIPFILVRNLGDSVLLVFDYPILLEIWGLVVDILYIIMAIIVFMNIFTKWFKNLKVETQHKVIAKELEAVRLVEDKKE